jgi:hypothetical protein
MYPFGAEREDWRMAQVCSIMANCWGRKQSKISDFMWRAEPSRAEAKRIFEQAKNTLAAAGLLKYGNGSQSKDTQR